LSDVVTATSNAVTAPPQTSVPPPKIHSVPNLLNNNVKKSDDVTSHVASETSCVTPPAASLDFEPVSPTPLPPDTPKSTNDDFFVEGKISLLSFDQILLDS
jgi:hypothetical protein